MSSVLLEKDGSIKLSEADVTQQIKDYLAMRGWKMIRTAADKVVHVSGRWTTPFEIGHPDWICVRPVQEIGRADFFYLETKARRGKTSKKRAALQAAFAQGALAIGFAVCRMPDGLDDPYGHFVSWYQAMYEGQNEDNASLREINETRNQVQEA
jgi:hypothetical protein